MGDEDDNCPFHPNNSQRDTDEDGFGDACDNCPEIANLDQSDVNEDGQGDVCQDTDEDGVPDVEDNCPLRRNPAQVDNDEDGVGRACDNCPDDVPNPDQADEDGNGIGDACDLGDNDRDLDGVLDDNDNCPDTPNPGQADPDDDGVGSACDNCPDEANANQADENEDGVGDACPESDRDDDGTIDVEDNCPDTPNENQADGDDDGRGNACDNCPGDPNFDQSDVDGDGRGDVCDPAAPRVWITLEWGDRAVDFDLHVLNADGTYFGDGDCWAGNRNPDWCDPGYVRDAPGQAPPGNEMEEQVRLGEPAPGWYTAAVDLFFREDGNRGAARVTFNCGENDPVVFGPRELLSQSGQNRSLWEVLRFNPEDCSVDPIDAVREMVCEGGVQCECIDCDGSVCGGCPDGNQCDPEVGECVDLCADVMCPDGEECDPGNGECTDRFAAQCRECGGGGNGCPDGFQCVGGGFGGGPAFCLAECEEDVDCPNGVSCVARRGPDVCAPEGGCDAEPDPCDGVECGDNELCIDGECEARANPDLSDWGNGNQAPNCDNNGDCTEDEECRDAFGNQQICFGECEDILDCPNGFICCETDFIGGGPFCLPGNNQLAGACQ